MKRIGITFTILETIDLSENYLDEDVQKAIDEILINLNLNRNIVNDIEYDEIESY